MEGAAFLGPLLCGVFLAEASAGQCRCQGFQADMQ